jgi:predicted dehydrogenase
MFHPSVKRIKKILDSGRIGKPIIFNFHSGSYLPDWHPWEKLKDYYVYKKSTGGGRDQIAWELSWIIWLMGSPKVVSAMTRKVGDFKADIYDTYDLSVEFESGTHGHILVDVIQRPPGRICEIICRNGHITWDYHRKTVLLHTKNKTYEFPEHMDYKGHKLEKPERGFAIKDRGVTESYVEEIKNFIDAINKKKKPEYTLEEEKILLKTMFASEKSSQTMRHIRIS